MINTYTQWKECYTRENTDTSKCTMMEPRWSSLTSTALFLAKNEFEIQHIHIHIHVCVQMYTLLSLVITPNQMLGISKLVCWRNIWFWTFIRKWFNSYLQLSVPKSSQNLRENICLEDIMSSLTISCAKVPKNQCDDVALLHVLTLQRSPSIKIVWHHSLKAVSVPDTIHCKGHPSNRIITVIHWRLS